MNKSIDIFAETNPIFCSLVLLRYCEGYFEESTEGLSYPLLLFPIPIVLSGDLEDTFTGTSISTGLYRWIENNKYILLNLSTRIEDSICYIKPAIEYAFYKNILTINGNGYIYPNSNEVKLPQSIKNINEYLTFAKRLGNWMGQINSDKTIFNYLGIEL